MWCATRWRDGVAPTTLRDGLAVAERLGAGRLVWGELWEAGDTTYVRGAVYDVTRPGDAIVERTIRLQPGQVGSAFTALADSLVLGYEGSAPPREGPAGTESFAALRAYGEAYAAIARWDLLAATARLREALALDRQYPMANLRMAQVGQWQDLARGGVARLRGPGTRLRSPVFAGQRRGTRARRPRGRPVSRGVCPVQRTARARLPRLQRVVRTGRMPGSKDDMVVPSRASPSGWAFRSSQWSAIAAYRRALELVPSVHVAYQGAALFRLEELLYTEPDGCAKAGR